MMPFENWDKELFESIKKTELILETVQSLTKRIDKLETKLDRVLQANGFQDVSIGKFQEHLAVHEEKLKELDKEISDLTKKFYKILGVFSAVIFALQFILNLIIKYFVN